MCLYNYIFGGHIIQNIKKRGTPVKLSFFSMNNKNFTWNNLQDDFNVSTQLLLPDNHR